MPWYTYAALTAEDADAVVHYLKNGVPAVNNQVPAASLNPGFTVMAPEGGDTASTRNVGLSPSILIIIALGIVLLVSFAVYFLRRKSASS
jgi:hypothetical protein